MFSFPKKSNDRQGMNRLHRWMEKRQRLTADYLSNKVARWSRKQQLFFLIITGGGYFVCLIFILFSAPAPQHMEHIPIPPERYHLPDTGNGSQRGQITLPQDTITIYYP